MKREEKFYHKDKVKIELYCEGIDDSIIMKEVEVGSLTVTLPAKVKEWLKSKPVLFCPEDRLTKYKDRSLDEFVAENLPKLSTQQKNEVEDFLNSIDPNIETMYAPRRPKRPRSKVELVQSVRRSRETFEETFKFSEQGSVLNHQSVW